MNKTGFRPISDETMRRLKTLPENFRHSVIPWALADWAREDVHPSAVANLSGARLVTGKGKRKRSVHPGQYPVNVVTGHLRGNQRYVLPGKKGLSLHQVAFANTAIYSAVIHDGGRGRSPRPFVSDAIDQALPLLDGRVVDWIDEVV